MRKLLNPYNLTGEEFKRINEFWKNYGKLFSKQDQYYFQRYLLSAFEEDAPLKYLSIYSFMGILPEAKDVYSWFLNFLQQYYPNFLDNNILEVSCGKIPALVKLISEAIERNHAAGSITGIDSELVISNIKNASLIKDTLNCESNISSYDTIIGIAPCEATPIAIKRACLEEKELSLMLCGCVHTDGVSFYPDYDAYLNHIYNIVKYHINSNFTYDINYAPKHLNYEYPILSLKRK